MNKITNIVILAGGDGDRFWPFGQKFFTRFLGESFLHHMLVNLAPLCKNMFVVGSSSNSERIRSAIAGTAGFLLQENPNDGMAGAVLACKGSVHGDTLIIGNDYIDFKAVEKMTGTFRDSAFQLTFLAKKMNSVYFPGGYLQLKKGKLCGLIEKPEPNQVPSDLVRLVVDYFRDIDDFITAVEGVQSDRDDRYERAMNGYILQGKADFIEYDGIWQALKYPWHVLKMDKIFLSTLNGSVIDKSAEISKTAIIVGPVHIGENCKIGEFVKINGPAYIGKGSVIGDYSLIRESSLQEKVVVGSGCEVARSHLEEGVSLHRNYVGDSVIGRNVLFGSGAVTANFRFDKGNVFSKVGVKHIDTDSNKLGSLIGDDSKVGVNANIYPGVKIGANSIIAPGETVRDDVPANTFFCKGIHRINKI